MTAIDPVNLVKEVLTDAGFTDVNSDQFEPRALSAPEYVFIEEVPGSTPHINLSYRPTIRVVVYSTGGFTVSRASAYRIQEALKAARGTAFTNGGIHRVITRVSPYRQSLSGLPYGVGRTVAEFDLILATLEKWS